MKKSFILYLDNLNVLDELSDEEAGQLFKAIKQYQTDKTINLTGLMKALFIQFQTNFDKNDEEYNSIVERNRENGKKGGRPKTQNNPKNPSGFLENPKNLDNDNDNENDNELILSYKSINSEKESEQKVFSSPKVDPLVLVDRVKQEYKSVIGKDCFINQSESDKLMSLYLATPDFFETLNSVLWNLKALQDLWKQPKPIGLGFSPPFSWLLKDNFKNYSDIRNGVYEEQVAKWRKEYRLKRSQELAKQLEQEQVCYG